ncbi:hypothetical protein Tco_0777668 [Tanacetum coccineum]
MREYYTCKGSQRCQKYKDAQKDIGLQKIVVGFLDDKAKFKTMSIDELYTQLSNFTSDVNMINFVYEVSTVSPNINTASPQVSTASFSDNAVYAFMVENPNGSNLLQQDLDAKGQARKFSLMLMILLYDKSKVECFNCHTMGHFARDVLGTIGQGGSVHTNQDNTRKHGNNERTSSKALLAIDGCRIVRKSLTLFVINKLDDSKENSDDSLVKEQVPEDTGSFVESSLNVDKETIFLDKKIEFVKPKNHEKPVKNSVRFNTTAGNPVKKILLKLNLSDHRLFKDGGGVIMEYLVKISKKARILELKQRHLKITNTLAEYMILSGAENRPPMLDKDLYDSLKSRMELYMQNREHGRMILESVEHGLLIWPTIEENGVTRTKKYAELFAAEKIQADCDMKATNIIFQGLPADIYSLVNHHRVAKDLWERVQLLVQGTSLTKQERECKLYDAFDKFAHIKGESLHQYYLRFTQLINDMNIYKMKLEQFQVNTKFLNSLTPEWSKFVTDVKPVKDLDTTNFDQLHAYLQQHELYANEVRLMRERNQDPLALSPQYGSIHPTQHYSTTYPSIPLPITYPSTLYPNAYSSTVHQDASPQPQSIPQIKYTVSIVNQKTHLAEFPQIHSVLAVLVFKQDLIDAINKMMSFLSTVVSSRFPTTNNQLRNSSNLRQQATIHDGRVTVQPL